MDPDLAERAEGVLGDLLAKLGKYSPVYRTDVKALEDDPAYPSVLRRMILACRPLVPTFITPLAAVAGAVADEVLTYLVRQGAEWAYVDNGGDVALHPGLREPIRVGLARGPGRRELAAQLEISAVSPVRGIATSGLGGRSLTLGIASAASVLGGSAAEADAAVTLIANATYIEHPKVKTVPAEEIDPGTDLQGRRVVVAVGPLEEEAVGQALRQGRELAESLMGQGLISGAAITVQGETAYTKGFREIRGIKILGVDNED